MKNPTIFTQRNVAMQSISDKMRFGYIYHIAGTTPDDKIEPTFDLFDMNYQALATKNEREKRKRHGMGNVHLVPWYKDDLLHWWIFAKPELAGRHPIHETDNLKNALLKEQRIVIDGFELVRTPNIGTDRLKWTWRMTQENYEAWQGYIIKTVRSRSYSQMNTLLRQLWSSPGFSGVRKQIGTLVNLYRAEVRRAALKDAPKPPKRLFYLNRLRHDGIRLKALLKQIKDKS